MKGAFRSPNQGITLFDTVGINSWHPPIRPLKPAKGCVAVCINSEEFGVRFAPAWTRLVLITT